MVRSCVLAVVFAALAAPVAWAQFTVPVARPTPETLFRNQCATCHALNASDPPRQGPNLAGVIDRKAGSVPDFKYSAGFANADFNWDDQRLDAYLTNPQAIIPGAVMPYRQANAETRKSIISYLEGQH